jgi:cytoskeletal protein RodZ
VKAQLSARHYTQAALRWEFRSFRARRFEAADERSRRTSASFATLRSMGQRSIGIGLAVVIALGGVGAWWWQAETSEAPEPSAASDEAPAPEFAWPSEPAVPAFEPPDASVRRSIAQAPATPTPTPSGAPEAPSAPPPLHAAVRNAVEAVREDLRGCYDGETPSQLVMALDVDAAGRVGDAPTLADTGGSAPSLDCIRSVLAGIQVDAQGQAGLAPVALSFE